MNKHLPTWFRRGCMTFEATHKCLCLQPMTCYKPYPTTTVITTQGLGMTCTQPGRYGLSFPPSCKDQPCTCVQCDTLQVWESNATELLFRLFYLPQRQRGWRLDWCLHFGTLLASNTFQQLGNYLPEGNGSQVIHTLRYDMSVLLHVYVQWFNA